MDHPCNLTKTTVRISFPELKGEVFVNLLGYKEPNLIPLWRCKGKTTFKSTDLKQKLEHFTFSRESDSTTTNVSSSVRPSESKTPKQL